MLFNPQINFSLDMPENSSVGKYTMDKFNADTAFAMLDFICNKTLLTYDRQIKRFQLW